MQRVRAHARKLEDEVVDPMFASGKNDAII